MARWAAGQRVTAGRLSLYSASSTLSTGSPTATGTWQQWGGEEATVSDPGLNVMARAWVSGYAVEATGNDTRARVRVEISLDGGVNFDSGQQVSAQVGDAVNRDQLRSPTVAGFRRVGNTTGDVVARAMMYSDSTSVEYWNGFLELEVVPE